MLSSIVIVVIASVCLLFFIFYRRKMLLRMFSFNMTASTQHFQQQLEETADIVIKRLEEQINHLEFLLEEANAKIISLDNKIQEAEKVSVTETAPLPRQEKYRDTSFSVPEQDIEEYKMMRSQGSPLQNKALATNKIANLSQDDYRDMARHDKRGSIIAMTELGYDINQIAQTTGISKGEIMLLLQLNKFL